MNITETIFDKKPNEIKLEDLNLFFSNEREESEIIEFKSFYDHKQNNYKHKENAILKTVCGFLNSNGGVVIWGAPVEKKSFDFDSGKFFKGDLSPVDRYINKDDFINKTVNRITLPPTGIQFYPIEVGTDKYVYIIEVKKSITKPHQFDNRYFIRLDGQTINAPHYYIEAMFKQIQHPNLGGYIKFGRLKTDGYCYYQDIAIFIFNHSPLQNEENISFSLTVSPGKFKVPEISAVGSKISYSGDHMLKYNKIIDVLHYGEPATYNTKILTKPDELANNEDIMDFVLLFGGKTSPMKKSHYKLRFDSKLTTNSNSLVIFKEENRMIHDIDKEMELNEKDKVDKLLER